MSVVPKDPVILLSVINTRLRDQYSSLSVLCEDLQLEETRLKEKIAAIGYTYDSDRNQFI